jgi:hypothetical protein
MELNVSVLILKLQNRLFIILRQSVSQPFHSRLLQHETSIIDNLICLVVAVVDDKFLESARLVSDKDIG